MSDLHGNPHAEAIDPSGVTVEARAYLAVAYELRTATLVEAAKALPAGKLPNGLVDDITARLGLTEGEV